tara:strand:+ start:190 stop:660 length:471 start_codon:yes stop_codon:yes gene_type:complete
MSNILKSPNEVLTHFIAALNVETAMQFAMDEWYTTHGFTESKPADVENVCGTSACLAGTVAFQLDPKSEETASALVRQWAGVTEARYNARTEEEIACAGSFASLFTDYELYGESYDDLAEVSKDDVLRVLAELVAENHETWESTYESIVTIIHANQ